ncbi:GL25724 [Drosophila persimilis]|uniref:GL25724 n=1 Tax=Drosophila persimilis TaxID=7234 RepID=B4GUD5_DROPE|nr:GL25724 [Drosophila persimilis]
MDGEQEEGRTDNQKTKIYYGNFIDNCHCKLGGCDDASSLVLVLVLVLSQSQSLSQSLSPSQSPSPSLTKLISDITDRSDRKR